MNVRVAAFLLLGAPAWAQFQLFIVDTAERAAPPLYDCGAIYPNESAATRFLLRNISPAPAAVTTLVVAGAGFTLPAPVLPVTLAPQAILAFTVTFRAADAGTYSATLRSDGVSILLTATVLPRLTLSGSFDFGTVVRGSSSQQKFTIVNGTSQTLIVPAISVQGADFSLSGVPPSGQQFQPRQAGEFTVVFAPRAAGSSQGALTFGDRSYTLTGAGAEPALPKPFLTIELKQTASARQGLAVVRYDAPAKTSGSGSLTLDFRGPADPTVSLASGGRTAAFAVAPGDTQASFPFQTGTTAGTLSFSVQLGQSSDQLSVTIPPSPTSIAGASGTRSASSVDVALTGFDNTRTLGALSFVFYDANGSALGGALAADAAGDFRKYFSASTVGGAFLMHALFPVTGDSSRIASCDVTMTNSAGNTKAPRITF